MKIVSVLQANGNDIDGFVVSELVIGLEGDTENTFIEGKKCVLRVVCALRQNTEWNLRAEGVNGLSIVSSLWRTSSNPSRTRRIGMILSQVRILAVRSFLNISARATKTLGLWSIPKIAIASQRASTWLGEKIIAPSVGIFSLPTYRKRRKERLKSQSTQGRRKE